MNYNQPYSTFNPVYPPRPVAVNTINWVQGIEGAKAHQLAPNSRTVLLDSEQNRMYIKTCDDIGMCSLRIFDFTEVTDTSQLTKNVVAQQDMSEYVTHKELEDAIAKISGGNTDEFISVNESKPKPKSK